MATKEDLKSFKNHFPQLHRRNLRPGVFWSSFKLSHIPSTTLSYEMTRVTISWAAEPAGGLRAESALVEDLSSVPDTL